MKTKIFTIALAFITLNAFSQITVTDNDVVDVGDVIYQAYDSNSVNAINIGSIGTNQTWDFSSLQESSINELFFISPLGTIYENQYPNANLCLDDNGSFSYYNKTNSGLYMYGIGDTIFNSPVLFYPLPLYYGLTVADGPIVIIDTAITGPFLAMAIPPSTVASLTNGSANRADTILLQTENTTEFSVNATGTIIIPLGTFDVLRLKRVQTTTSVLNVYCSDTISGLGSWVPNVPFSAIPFLAGLSNNEIEYKYQWITNDVTVEFILAEIVVDDSDNIINGVSFQTSAPTSLIAVNMQEKFSVFPVPATYSLTIEGEENITTDLTLRDINGKLILTHQFNTSTNLSLDGVAKGIYYLTLKTENGELTKKVVVE